MRLVCLIVLLTVGPVTVVAQRSHHNAAALPQLPSEGPQGQETDPALQVSSYRGQVTFNGLPVPGATVTATRGSKRFSTITDQQGRFSFLDLADGSWTIEVRMTGFSTVMRQVTVAPKAPPVHGEAVEREHIRREAAQDKPAEWELRMLPLAEIKAEKVMPGLGPASGTEQAEASPGPTSEPAGSSARNGAAASAANENKLNQLAAPGLLINGSVNNGAASPFAQFPAFGNNRRGAMGLYRGSLGINYGNSAFDARPFSLSGHSTPKPFYNRVTGVLAFGGPMRIPHIVQNGPFLYVGYQWTRDVNDLTQSALVPSLAERTGDFSQALNASGQPIQIFDPATGLPFSGDVIPPGLITPQAQALLNFYPRPNFSGGSRYNYQTAINGNTHSDALQSRFQKSLGGRNQLSGGFAFQSTHSASPNLFGFRDTTQAFGLNTDIRWWHRVSEGLSLNVGYQFSRQATRVTPYFENRENVSGEAGIAGNDQSPVNWGPPNLSFASGIAGLSDGQSSFGRNQTSAVSASMLWIHGRHNITFGGDFRRQEFNELSQHNPRGAFTFTGAATAGSAPGTGFDFADFLLGIPDTSAIAFGNADKYFRESVYDAYITDDFRISPGFTLNAGVRWEYGAPITELYGRLVNLDIAPGFSAVAPVLASDPVGPLTGDKYPASLVRPDWVGFEPRVGIAWRPIGGSSLLIRAGYGIYDNTSVYQTLVQQMAQQSPLSKSLSVQNSPACPLTLADGFTPCSAVTPDNFAIDPNFRVGYAQVWQFSIQRDLPGSMQLSATYLGTKGTRALQEFLPNTYPLGAANLCPACPVGFAYFASNGNSTRESGQVQLRRRLASGFAASLQYTYSKSIDDASQLGGEGAVGPGLGSAALGATTIAQDWLNLAAERSLSSFDQRHLLSLTVQYTSGMGLAGGTLMSGKKGALLKEWTFLTNISVGSGLPETPLYLAPVPGTGVTGSLRPDYTGAPLYSAPPGFDLNPAAYVAPLAGEWGTAGRNSIIGPAQFSLDASLARSFQVGSKYTLDLRIDSANALNHVNYTGWNTVIGGAQFGLPSGASSMRTVRTTLRLSF